MPFCLNHVHSVGEVLAFAARNEIMPRFRNLTPAKVRRKSSTFDFVTEADRRCRVGLRRGSDRRDKKFRVQSTPIRHHGGGDDARRDNRRRDSWPGMPGLGLRRSRRWSLARARKNGPALRCGSRPCTRIQNGRLHQHDYMPEPLSITVNANLSRSATSTSLRCAAHGTARWQPDIATFYSTIG